MRMKKPKIPKVAEADLAKYTLCVIQSYGIFGWRVPVGGVLRQRDGGVFFQKSPMKGHPDFAGVTKQGRMWVLELKSSSGKLTVEQELWLSKFKQHNALVCVAKTMVEIEAFLKSVAGDVYP